MVQGRRCGNLALCASPRLETTSIGPRDFAISRRFLPNFFPRAADSWKDRAKSERNVTRMRYAGISGKAGDKHRRWVRDRGAVANRRSPNVSNFTSPRIEEVLVIRRKPRSSTTSRLNINSPGLRAFSIYSGAFTGTAVWRFGNRGLEWSRD